MRSARARAWIALSLGSLALGAPAGLNLIAATRASYPAIPRRATGSELRSLASSSNAPSLLAPDKGKFRILVGGQQAGKEEFEINASGGNWIARGNSEIQTSQGAARVTGTLELRPDGTPVRYEWAMQGAKKASSTITFNGMTANVELRLEGARPFMQQFTFASAPVAILDNNMYHQYAILARLYDWEKKGAQTFSVLVPQEMTPGTVTVESLGKQEAGGAKLEELRVKTEDLEIDLFLDGQRLVRIVSPSTNAEIIRE
jgi:hypothetical protein